MAERVVEISQAIPNAVWTKLNNGQGYVYQTTRMTQFVTFFTDGAMEFSSPMTLKPGPFAEEQ